MILLGDADRTVARVMDYTFETCVTLEDWFDPRGDIFPAEFKHDTVGMNPPRSIAINSTETSCWQNPSLN